MPITGALLDRGMMALEDKEWEKADGTVVAVDSNKYGQCNVRGWTNIKVPQK